MNESTPVYGLRSPAEVLEALMYAHGVSQTELARRLGVSKANVNNVFRGESGLSYDEYSRWLGVLGYEPAYGAAPSPTAGYFRSREEVWPWLLRRLRASRKPEPRRTAGELLGLLEQAGVGPEDWRRLLPGHLAPVLASGWLWREGTDTALRLAVQVEAARREVS